MNLLNHYDYFFPYFWSQQSPFVSDPSMNMKHKDILISLEMLLLEGSLSLVKGVNHRGASPPLATLT